MTTRLTDEDLAQFRATWLHCDAIMLLDEIAALKADLSLAGAAWFYACLRSAGQPRIAAVRS